MGDHDELAVPSAQPIPATMRAWVLGGPNDLMLTTKPVPVPRRAEVLVRIDAVAICARLGGHPVRLARTDPRRQAIQEEFHAGS
jgi:hypothetical protein